MVPDIFSFLDDVPEYAIAVIAYFGSALFILWGWYQLGKYLPRTFAGMTWIILFALIFSPTLSEGDNAKIAPAVVGLMFGLITHEKTLIWTNLIPILVITALGFFLGYLWSKYQDQRQSLIGK